MWLDLRKAGFHTHNGRPHFSLLLDSLTNGLTFHASPSAQGSPVCFCWGLFHRRVWRPRRRGCSSRGLGWSQQNVNWLGFATRLDNDISHWFSNFLWYFQHNRASVGPSDISGKKLKALTHPPTPLPPPLGTCICDTGEKNYLKWREVQLTAHWRLCPLKYLV